MKILNQSLEQLLMVFSNEPLEEFPNKFLEYQKEPKVINHPYRIPGEFFGEIHKEIYEESPAEIS